MQYYIYHLFCLFIQDDSTKVPEESDTYLEFDLVLSDVSAFMIDGDYNWSHPKDSRLVCLLPVIDKCGIVVKLQQVSSFIKFVRVTLKYAFPHLVDHSP